MACGIGGIAAVLATVLENIAGAPLVKAVDTLVSPIYGTGGKTVDGRCTAKYYIDD